MIEIKKDVKLAGYTTFGIGGPADYFVTAANQMKLKEALLWAKTNKVKVYILGGGSNILVSDKGVRGLVIKIDFQNLQIENEQVIVDAGFSASKLVEVTANHGLAGLEYFAGLPGTVGGAIYKNSHWRGRNFSDKLEWVDSLDHDLQLKRLTKDRMSFSYDWSSFQGTSTIILRAGFRLEKAEKTKLQAVIDSVLVRREQNQPKGKSAGCIFKNPGKASAGRLLESAGLKGSCIGKITISDLHANYFLNAADGSARDVWNLIKKAKLEVKNKFNLDIEPEIFFWGDFE